ncbi:MAG: hypothetical protein AAGC70_17765 [Pseudomonadota bacterium]
MSTSAILARAISYSEECRGYVEHSFLRLDRRVRDNRIQLQPAQFMAILEISGKRHAEKQRSIFLESCSKAIRGTSSNAALFVGFLRLVHWYGYRLRSRVAVSERFGELVIAAAHSRLAGDEIQEN